MEYLLSFVVGGAICAFVQIFFDRTKLLPGRIMVSLVVIGAIVGAIGWYEPLMEQFGAGVSVPLLGFGNSLWKGVKEGIEEDGILGIFTGGLTATSGGITAALVFSYLISLITKPKMK